MKIKHLLCFIALCLFFTPGKAQQVSVMTLRNGATVYIWEDKSKHDVFGMIAFKVGTVDDPEQYTGLAHYLEHVMFKGDVYKRQDRHPLVGLLPKHPQTGKDVVDSHDKIYLARKKIHTYWLPDRSTHSTNGRR